MCAFRSPMTKICSNPVSLNGKQEKSAMGNGAAKTKGATNNNGAATLNGAARGNGAPKTNGAARASLVKPSAVVPLLQLGRLRKIMQKIESDSFRTIQDLALECNLSQSHLQHLFKERTGLGLGHLLTEKRMQRASDLLSETDKSIKEIACLVGYEHTSSFTRAFERHFRQSPRSYRQAQCLSKILTSKRVG
jgi:AraC-like DNA-binding protein